MRKIISAVASHCTYLNTEAIKFINDATLWEYFYILCVSFKCVLYKNMESVLYIML